jgi:hypothetical protein
MIFAFYKGTLQENPGAKLFDRLVCWRTRGRFSHVELVADGKALCFSSSLRDGGVRAKQINLHTGRWVLVELPDAGNVMLGSAMKWFRVHAGAGYDWFSLLAFVVPLPLRDSRRWYCSEAVGMATRLWTSRRKISPNKLFTVILDRGGKLL